MIWLLWNINRYLREFQKSISYQTPLLWWLSWVGLLAPKVTSVFWVSGLYSSPSRPSSLIPHLSLFQRLNVSMSPHLTVSPSHRLTVSPSHAGYISLWNGMVYSQIVWCSQELWWYHFLFFVFRYPSSIIHHFIISSFHHFIISSFFSLIFVVVQL